MLFCKQKESKPFAVQKTCKLNDFIIIYFVMVQYMLYRFIFYPVVKLLLIAQYLKRKFCTKIILCGTKYRMLDTSVENISIY